MTDKENQMINDLDFPCKEKVTINGKEYFIEVLYDENPDNPRDWDNLGTIAYSHSRYVLGDEIINDRYISAEDAFYLDLAIYQDELPEEKLHASILNYYEHDVEGKIYSDEVTREKMIEFVHNKYIILPVYLYDHSGITINTTGFLCRWDSGQVGFIYVGKEKVKKEFGWKKLSPKRERIIKSILRGEIETFDQYIRGEVYICNIQDIENEDNSDTCGGLYSVLAVKEFILDVVQGKRIYFKPNEEIKKDE